MSETLSSPGSAGAEPAACGAWNPGIASQVPPALLGLSTIFRPENSATAFGHVRELGDFTGLPLEELVIFRPQRLVVHELLIRVTADLSVPDGPRPEDLGINFRRMTDTIFSQYLLPHMTEITAEYAEVERALAAFVDAELDATLFAPAPAAQAVGERKTFTARLAGRFLATRDAPKMHPRAAEPWEREEHILREWAGAQSGDDPLQRAAHRALVRIVSALRIRHGRVGLDKPLVASLATGIAFNDYGSEVLGRVIDPHVRRAAAQQGYSLLPAQARPVVMNTKGASASGKSTMRPLQRKLAGEIGANWGDFALISPDIWRKYLLDYGSLGDAYKYAGAFAGVELGIIDAKLDRYMAQKAERGEMSHLLIDRFRFDSFAPDSEEAGSNLLTRFGHLIYMFFLIAPPHATVERAWKRGLEVGRYKAVDDVLAHNVEAYTGMPQLFFTWALRSNKSVHYEFLDNSVPSGERPRTAAFGWNGEMNIFDVKSMIDIDRYRRIDVNATSPERVYPGGQAMAAERNVQFLVQCARRIPAVNLAESATGRVYARLESGRLAWTDPEVLARAMADRDTRAGVLAVAPEVLEGSRNVSAGTQPRVIEAAARRHTLGQWGTG